jgi:hypothetical protein
MTGDFACVYLDSNIIGIAELLKKYCLADDDVRISLFIPCLSSEILLCLYDS